MQPWAPDQYHHRSPTDQKTAQIVFQFDFLTGLLDVIRGWQTGIGEQIPVIIGGQFR